MPNQPPLNPDAIEAGAKALFMRERKYHTPSKECPEPPSWEDLTDTSLEHYRGNARTVLAVAPQVAPQYVRDLLDYSTAMRAALVAIQEQHKPAQVWHKRYTTAGILVSATTTDGPCVICNPSITDEQHCDSCTNDGLEGGDPESWCDGVRPSYKRQPWPCPTRRLADDALGGTK